MLREHKGSVVVSMLLTWLLSAGIVVVILMTPTYLQKVHGISPADALTANSWPSSPSPWAASSMVA